MQRTRYAPFTADLSRPTGNLLSRRDEFMAEAERQIEAERDSYCPIYFADDRANMIWRRAEFLSIGAVQKANREWAEQARARHDAAISDAIARGVDRRAA